MPLSAAGENFVRKYHEVVGAVSLGRWQAPELKTSAATAKGGAPVVNLTWTYPAELQDALTGFEITRVSKGNERFEIFISDKATTNTTDSSVVSGATYRYQIRAICVDHKSFFSAESSVTV